MTSENPSNPPTPATPESHENAAAKARQPQNEPPPTRTEMHTKPTHPHYEIACNKKRDGWDRAKMGAEFLGIIFLIVYTLYTSGIYRANKDAANATKKAAETAEKQLEMSERPWVVTHYTPSAPLEFHPDGSATFAVLGKVTNIGHSVALYVHDTPLISLQDTGLAALHPTAKQKDVCDRIRETEEKFPDPAGGETLFPGESAYANYPLTFPKEEVQKATVAKIDAILGLAIIGCVDYKFSFSPKHHQTGYVYDIVKLNPLGVGTFPLKVGVDVPANDLTVRRSLFGGFYAD